MNQARAMNICRKYILQWRFGSKGNQGEYNGDGSTVGWGDLAGLYGDPQGVPCWFSCLVLLWAWWHLHGNPSESVPFSVLVLHANLVIIIALGEFWALMYILYCLEIERGHLSPSVYLCWSSFGLHHSVFIVATGSKQLFLLCSNPLRIINQNSLSLVFCLIMID